MCVHLCALVGAHARLHVSAEARGHHQCLLPLPTLFLETRSATKLTDSAMLAGQQAPGTLSPSPQPWDYIHSPLGPALYMDAYDRNACLPQECFTDQAVSPTPEIKVLIKNSSWQRKCF